jgi:protein involved in polysaccharide export with SLBB domain
MRAVHLTLMLTNRLRGRAAGLALALAVGMLATGCAAITNPVADGIPVKRLPPEYFATPKEDAKTIPLTLLRQPAPDTHHVDAGDILGIYIGGVTGEKTAIPPVQYPNQITVNPAVGVPAVVAEDGTLPLPLVPPIPVKGLTISQVRDLVVETYTVKYKIINQGKEKGTTAAQVLVSLIRPRQVRVQVVRQDSGTVTIAPGVVGNTRRGTGTTVDLPAYENDVLNALNRTGGLPGLDAINEVIIQRDEAAKPGDRGKLQVVRIPLRMREGEQVPFQPADVILKTGDILFIESRDTEVFYVGGLMAPRQFVLPRDLDIRVVDAIIQGGGPIVNGGITQNNLSGNIIASGLGSPSPSKVTVLRRTKGHGQVSIVVDLNKALNDPRENILVQAGDVIIMQETVGEAITRYWTSVFRFNFFDIFSKQGDFLGTFNSNLP